MYAPCAIAILTYSYSHTLTLSLFIFRTTSKVMDWHRKCITSLGNAPASGFLGGIMIVYNHLAESLVELLTTGSTILPDIFMEPVELIDTMCCPSILGELGVTVFLLFACT